MIIQLSQVILKFVYKHLDLSPEMKDIYRYGIEVVLSSILNIILVLGASLLIRDFFAGAIFLLLFISLRSFTGGYHASTYFKCNSIMLITFLTVCLFYKKLCQLDVNIHIYEFLSLVNLIPIFVFAPVQNKHKQLSKKQKRANYIFSVIMSILLSISALFLIMYKIKYGVLIVITLSSISVMIIIGTLLQRRECYESEESNGSHHR